MFFQHLTSNPSATPVGSTIHLYQKSNHLSPPTSTTRSRSHPQPHPGSRKRPNLGCGLPPLPCNSSLSEPGRPVSRITLPFCSNSPRALYFTLLQKSPKLYSGLRHPTPPAPFPPPCPHHVLSYSAPASGLLAASPMWGLDSRTAPPHLPDSWMMHSHLLWSLTPKPFCQ